MKLIRNLPRRSDRRSHLSRHNAKRSVCKCLKFYTGSVSPDCIDSAPLMDSPIHQSHRYNRVCRRTYKSPRRTAVDLRI